MASEGVIYNANKGEPPLEQSSRGTSRLSAQQVKSGKQQVKSKRPLLFTTLHSQLVGVPPRETVSGGAALATDDPSLVNRAIQQLEQAQLAAAANASTPGESPEAPGRQHWNHQDQLTRTQVSITR